LNSFIKGINWTRSPYVPLFEDHRNRPVEDSIVVVHAGIPVRPYLLLLLFLVPIGGCSRKSPTSTSFAFTGGWSGTWTDPTLILASTYRPVSLPLTIEIDPDGVAEVDAYYQEQYVEGPFVDRLRMTLQVWPDGSVYGTGIWNQGIPGESEVVLTGEVIGQFDELSDSGSGVLVVEYYGTNVHLVWKVTRSP
jgi:hypothetical protein